MNDLLNFFETTIPLWLSSCITLLISLLLWLFLRQRHTMSAVLMSERVQEGAARLAELAAQYAGLETRHAAISNTATTWQVHAAELQVRLEQEQKAAAQRESFLANPESRLVDTFKALSADTLNATQSSFLELARAMFEKHQQSAQGDLHLRQQAAAQFLFCKIGDQVWGGLVEFMLR